MNHPTLPRRAGCFAIGVAFLVALAGTAPSAASPTVADGAWSLLPFPPPSPRTQHTSIYDPVRQRILVFGGLSGSTLMNDVWELTLTGTPTWTRLTIAGVSPSPRRGSPAIYDPVRDRMLLFGGFTGSSANDVWALSLAGTPSWTQLGPLGSPPSGRYGHSTIYDSIRDRMVVFGGQTGLLYRNDSWSLQLAGVPTWSAISPSGGPPATRSRHTAIYDASRDRMVVFGGTDGVDVWDDVWALAFAGSPAWSAPAPSGSVPTARFGHKAIFDATRDRMVVYGGSDGTDLSPDPLWSLAFSPSLQWTELAPGGILLEGRFDHAVALDPVGDRLVVFGGQAELPLNDLLALSLAGGTSWSVLVTAAGSPPARTGHAAVFDPVRNRMIVAAGRDAEGDDLNDVWALDLDDLEWADVTPASGQKPEARNGHVLVYDSLRDRAILFGGLGNDFLNDVWEVSLSGTPAWSKINPAGTPPANRYGAAGVYDPVGDRLIIFGGYDGLPMGDVWALSLAGTPTWTQLTPSGTPPGGRFFHTALRLAVSNEMLIFAGTDSTLFNDVWKLSLSGPPAWSPVLASGATPPPRYQSAAIHDAARQRLVIIGGFDGTNYLGDVRALSLSGSPTWTALAPTGSMSPNARQGHVVVFDAPGDQMLLFGGFDGIPRGDTWVLDFGGPTGVADRPAESGGPALRLRAAYPNPSAGPSTLAFELSSAREGRIAIFDLHGRLVRELANGLFPAGTNLVRWDGADSHGRAVASGAYFYRIESGAARLTRKVILIR